MARLLITTLLLHTLLLSATGMVTARLQIYETRTTLTIPLTSDTWLVEGIGTVEIGGTTPAAFIFDCNTTSGDGSQITWTGREMQIELRTEPITNGRRLIAYEITYSQLGDYVCQDRMTHDKLIINITDKNPAVCPVEDSEIRRTIVGGSVELKVYISGIPPPTSNQITWYRPNGSPISNSDDNVAFRDGKKRLVLTNVQRSDEGSYRCEAIIPELNQFSRASASVQLLVLDIQDPVDTTAREFMEVTLTCSATGSPIPIISWEREGGATLPITANISPAVDGETVNSTVNSTLTITDVRYDDRGMYRCKADNDETDEVVSEYALLTVIPDLRLEAVLNGMAHTFTDLIIISENSQLEVECSGSGTLEWRSSSQGVVISSDPQNQLYQSSDPSLRLQTLHIPNFFANVTAIYTCHSDLMDTSMEEGVLITSSNPAVFISIEEVFISIEEVFILPGNIISLNATVYASPPANVNWYHNDILVDPNQHFSLDNNRQTLNIENFEASLAGRYEIVASIGESSARDHVVLILPDPPTVNVTPSMVTVNENDMVQFRCQGGGSGDIDVEWSLVGGQSLPAGVFISENESGDEKSLTISRVDISHAGTYVCSVRNIAGETEGNAVLNVFYAPTAEVSYNQSSTTTTLELSFIEGNTAPQFSCSADGHLPPEVTWHSDAGSLPSGVITTVDDSGERPVYRLEWERSLEYTDSGTYACTARNDNGTSTVTLDILVQSFPVINSIYSIYPVQVDESNTYNVPRGHTGVALTCIAFAWPIPIVQWLKDGNPLPSGITSSSTENSDIVAARLEWTREFTQSDAGQYECLVSWTNDSDPEHSASQTVQIVEGSPSTTEAPSCSVDNRTVLFQVRVLDFNCEERNTSLDRIVESFQEQLFRVAESECTCNAQPSHIQVEPLQCSERITGAAVFLGKIETNSTSLTQDIFCALSTWRQSGASLNIDGEFYDIDSRCSLQVDSCTVEECAVTDACTEIDNGIIIILAASVGGIIVVAILITLTVIYCLCCCARRKALCPRVNQLYSISPETPQLTSMTAPNGFPTAVARDPQRTPSSTGIASPSSLTAPSLTFVPENQDSPALTVRATRSQRSSVSRSVASPSSLTAPSLTFVPENQDSPALTVKTTRSQRSSVSRSVASPSSLTAPSLTFVPENQDSPALTVRATRSQRSSVSRSVASPSSLTAPSLTFVPENQDSPALTVKTTRSQRSSVSRSVASPSSLTAPSLTIVPENQDSPAPTVRATRSQRSSVSRSVASPSSLTAPSLTIVPENQDSPALTVRATRSQRSSVSRSVASPPSSTSVHKLALAPSISEESPPYAPRSRPPEPTPSHLWYSTDSTFSLHVSDRHGNIYTPQDRFSNPSYADVQPYATIHNFAIPLTRSTRPLARPLPPSLRACHSQQCRYSD